ncbi:MAG: glycosyl transferase family 1 [Bacteroidetes bacterium]|nr:MAG: glycosyl transferase family 1 [Bacteroidota bacterium]
MKILFISRSGLFRDKGGDTVQLLQTAASLRELGVDVDVRLCDEIIDYAPYDLLHFFNIIRPADILLHIRKSKKPYLVSTIFVDYGEYEKKVRKGIVGMFFKYISSDAIEYAKVLARYFLKGEKIISREYIWLGQKRAVKKIMSNASMLLPNSHSEYKRLIAHYHCSAGYRVIPNAIDPQLFKNVNNEKIRDENFVICVGRIEGRKNQLNLIKSVQGSRFRLTLIGSPAANQASYFEACKIAAGTNVEFIDNLPQEQLLQYYSQASIHVLPSWFETTGLSSLEAAAMGCRVVITDKGDTKEYFEDLAFYCEPGSTDSIREAIERASEAGFSDTLQKKILREYTWQIAAFKTLDAYKIVLSNKGL